MVWLLLLYVICGGVTAYYFQDEIIGSGLLIVSIFWPIMWLLMVYVAIADYMDRR